MTIGELTALVGGTCEGDGTAELTGFAPIESAASGQLSFLANEKYTPYIYSTQASAVLVGNSFEPEHPVPTVLIRVENPYATLAELMERMQASVKLPEGIESPSYVAEGVELPDKCYVGAFAYIGRGAKIGSGARIYPQVYIGDGCKIGEDTVIYAGAKIYAGCEIGSRCIIHSGAVIGSDGFGFAPRDDVYEKIPQMGNVVIADDVEIGANCTVDRATFGSTRIGQGTKIDNLVQIAHNVTIGKNNVFAAQGGVAGSTTIGDSNQFGGQVGIAGHIRIGDRNQVGAQSGIPNNVGSGKRLMGYPAVDARQFAKNTVYIKKLSELFKK